MARLLELADAVTAIINAGSWTETFLAQRTALPQYKATSDQVEVHVRPVKRQRVGPVHRGRQEWHYTIDIVVLKKCEVRDNDAFDPLLDLSYDLADAFEVQADGHFKHVLAAPQAWVHEVKDMPAAYAWEYALDDQFTSVKRLLITVMEG